MANAELNVILSADGDQLSSTLKKAGKDVQGFGTQLKTLPPALNKLDASVNKTSRTITAAGSAVRKSKMDFTNWSRVIQDLPFGLIGIQNNLTQLIPGVGLLGLAFSALITALTFSQLGFSNWTRGTKGVGDAAKKTGEEVETLADRQKRLKEVFDAAAKSLISQTTRIEDLGKALIDTSNKTDILSAATIKQGLAQLLFTAKEGLAQKVISDALQLSLTIEQQIFEFRQKEFKVAKKIGELKPLRIASDKELRASGFLLTKTEQQLFDLNKLAASLGVNFEKFVDAPKKLTLKVDTIKENLQPRILIENPILIKSQNYFASLRLHAAKMLEDLQDEIRRLTRTNPIIIEANRVQAEQKARGLQFKQALEVPQTMQERFPLLNDIQVQSAIAAKQINDVLAPAFDNLFSAIKAGENPLKAFFQGIGQAVTQLIQKLIAAVVQALIIQVVLKAAGLGGTQGSTGSIIAKLLGFKAQGGPVLGGKPYVVGEQGPELFIPGRSGKIIPNQQMNGLAGVTGGPMHITVDGRIRGRELRLVNARQQGFENRNL